MCALKEKKRLAYDKAIEGYQFQVGRYNTWMNYYAIFVGALFVALYTIWPNASDSCGCCCCKCYEVVSCPNIWGLLLVISILGWCTSACWYGALLGYQTWNSHWIGVVKKIEELVFATSNENMVENKELKVYGDMPETEGNSPYAKGFISTQKITGIFIFCIMLAWNAVFAFVIYSACGYSMSGSVWIFLTGAMFTMVSLIVLHNYCCGLFSSEIIK